MPLVLLEAKKEWRQYTWAWAVPVWIVLSSLFDTTKKLESDLDISSSDFHYFFLSRLPSASAGLFLCSSSELYFFSIFTLCSFVSIYFGTQPCTPDCLHATWDGFIWCVESHLTASSQKCSPHTWVIFVLLYTAHICALFGCEQAGKEIKKWTISFYKGVHFCLYHLVFTALL